MYFVISLLTSLAVFTILGMSFNLLMGRAGLFSLAHGAFFGLGAYTTSVLMRDSKVGFLPALIAAFAVTGAASVVVGLAARRVTDVYLVILTLAFQTGIVQLFSNLNITGGSGGFVGIPVADVFGWRLASSWQVAVMAWVICAVVAFGVWSVGRSPFARVLDGIREDEIAARSLGKRVTIAKVTIFVVSSAMAGVAGAVFAEYLRFIDPSSFDLNRSIEVLSLTIIGGLGAYWGPFVGAAVVVLVPQGLGLMPLPSSLVGVVNALVFSMLVLVLLRFRPQGLLGRKVWALAGPADATAALVSATDATARDATDPDSGLAMRAEGHAAPAAGRAGSVAMAWAGGGVGSNGGGDRGRVLRCEGVSISFGGLQAVSDVTMEISPGRITGLVGPNGAGKTTLFNLLTGVLTPDRGRVYLGEVEISRLALDGRARAGIVRSFQDMRLFAKMTASDNVVLPLTPVAHERLVSAGLLGLGSARQADAERRARARELLSYLGLDGAADALAGDLSYAEQKLLMIGRLLATRADCYLLDEPMSGLDQAGRDKVVSLLKDMVQTGAAICLVEHSLSVIQQACSWCAFLDEGRLIAEGPTSEITNNQELAAMYFGMARPGRAVPNGEPPGMGKAHRDGDGKAVSLGEMLTQEG